MSTFSDNYIQINQVWPQIQPKKNVQKFAPLIDWTFNWGQFHISIQIEFPDNQ